MFWTGAGLFIGGVLTGGTITYLLYHKIESRYEEIMAKLVALEQRIKQVL